MDTLEALEFLKRRKAQAAETITREKVVVLERKQVSASKPAIAQLKIIFPPSVVPPQDLITYFNDKKKQFDVNAKEHTIIKDNEFTYTIEIKGVLKMYAWMEYFIQCFYSDYGLDSKGYRIRDRGTWDNYDGSRDD